MPKLTPNVSNYVISKICLILKGVMKPEMAMANIVWIFQFAVFIIILCAIYINK